MIKTAGRSSLTSCEKTPYFCRFEWPDDCFCQCSDRGVVLTPSGSYFTAFFEAFPNDPDTFVRGEGITISDAEGDAWEKWRKILACPGHEFERRGRKNGVGYCKHCDLVMSNVFPPSEKCCVCGRPTYHTVDVDGNVYCEEHMRDKPLEKWTDMDWHIAYSEFEMSMYDKRDGQGTRS